jgi:fluoride exporter
MRQAAPRFLDGDALMKEAFLVACGGALGAVARSMLSGIVLHHTLNWKFPLGTFLVNAIGSVTAGVIAGLVIKQDMFTPAMRLFLLTGLLGGFTTFSAFGYRVRLPSAARRAHHHGAVCIGQRRRNLGGLLLAMLLIPGPSDIDGATS